MPDPVELVIVPPVALIAPPAVPVTDRPPEPVLFRTMPLAAPFDEMSWKVMPPAPIVVPETLRPIPAPELIVLLAFVAVTVPPPLASNALVPLELVLSVSVLVKPIVALVLPER